MPITNGEYQPRSADDIFQSLADELLLLEPSANPRSESALTYALLLANARNSAFNFEQDLQATYNSAYIEDATNENLTKKARNLGFIRKEATKATGVVEFSRQNDATADYVIPSGTVVETEDVDPIQFETTESTIIETGTKTAKANIVAVEAGVDGNVGADSIVSMPSPPTGVGSVTNPNPTGDTTVTDTNGDPLKTGRKRETDEQLRDRVFDTGATSEGPDPEGIRLGLQQTDGVVSVDINTNQKGTTVDGLDPYKTEVVVFGGNVVDIAETLTDVMSTTTLLRLQGGVNGSKESTTVPIDLLDDTVTVEITRPIINQLELTIDVVHDSTYGGTSVVKDAVVDYIGGAFSDGSVTNGQLIGEDVLVNIIENNVEDVGGVEYADVTLLDADGDGVDDTTTDSNGVPIYEVSSSSLARVDASDITLNETQV